ncbi:MAG: aspartate/glutamate racemase family protein [Candidatus Competibacteraceae bacterium]
MQPCPGLVEQIEAGDFTGPATRALVTRSVAPLLAKGADTLVLGCTHYPLLRLLIEEITGPAVQIIDTGPAVARHRYRRPTPHCIPIASCRARKRFGPAVRSRNCKPIIAKVWGQAVARSNLRRLFLPGQLSGESYERPTPAGCYVFWSPSHIPQPDPLCSKPSSS